MELARVVVLRAGWRAARLRATELIDQVADRGAPLATAGLPPHLEHCQLQFIEIN
jgi:hypothetical protein